VFKNKPPISVVRLIEELINQADPDKISTLALESMYGTTIDVSLHCPLVLNDVANFDSYQQKLEELLGTRRCKELATNRRTCYEEPY